MTYLPHESMIEKPQNTNHLIISIITRGWNVAPLMVLVAGARATTHIPSMKNLETILKLPLIKLKNTFQQINIIATQYAHSILVHKQGLEDKQSITNLQDLA
jgi:hypothetical protein